MQSISVPMQITDFAGVHNFWRYDVAYLVLCFLPGRSSVRMPAVFLQWSFSIGGCETRD